MDWVTFAVITVSAAAIVVTIIICTIKGSSKMGEKFGIVETKVDVGMKALHSKVDTGFENINGQIKGMRKEVKDNHTEMRGHSKECDMDRQGHTTTDDQQQKELDDYGHRISTLEGTT